MKMSCLLPRVKLPRVFFMKRSYLLPRENFKLSYLPNQAHWDPGICTQLRSSHIYSIHQKIARFHPRELCVFGPYLCRLILPRPRGEEGNCSYLLPLSHRVSGYLQNNLTKICNARNHIYVRISS